MQIHKVGFEVLRVLLPRYTVHSGGRVPLKPEIGIPEKIDVHMVEQRGEPLLLPFLCYFPYTLEPLGHTSPARCPACARLARVPLGLRPSLHPLRRRLPDVVRRLHRYYGGVCLLSPAHRRLRLLAFPPRTSP